MDAEEDARTEGHTPETEAAEVAELAGEGPGGEPPRRSAVVQLLRALAWVFVILFYGSLGWVVAYRFVEPPGTLLMVERSFQGEKIAQSWVPIERISPHLVRAVLAAEDSRFCLHTGIDFDAVEEALEEK